MITRTEKRRLNLLSKVHRKIEMELSRTTNPILRPSLYSSPIDDLPERKIGKFEIKHQIYPAGSILPLIGLRQAFMRNTDKFSTTITEPLRIHKLLENGSVWMTDMPEELNQIVEAVAKTFPAGNVLVGGLGLGILAKMVSNYPTVKSVTVVEQSSEIIALCKRPGYYSVVNDDITKFLEDHHKPFDCYMLDTWSGTGEETWWHKVMPLRRIIRNRWGKTPTIHCWAEDIMFRQVITSLVEFGQQSCQEYPDRKYWAAPKLPPINTAKKAISFFTEVGLPKWEKKYGCFITRSN